MPLLATTVVFAALAALFGTLRFVAPRSMPLMLLDTLFLVSVACVVAGAVCLLLRSMRRWAEREGGVIDDHSSRPGP